MIIYFEGISCAGKSHLIENLKKDSKVPLYNVEELPMEYSKITNIDDFCRENDERKSETALAQSKDHLVFVDRGYASTLAYSYIQYANKSSDEYIKSLAWYKKQISNDKLRKPDLYVYIKLDPETAIERAKKLNRFSTSIAWYTNPGLGNEFYDYFFKFVEPEVPLLVLDGNLSVEDKAKLFWEKIEALK